MAADQNKKQTRFGARTETERPTFPSVFLALMNSYEFHDQAPVSTLVKGKKKRKKGATVDPILGLVYVRSLVCTRSLSFLRETIVKHPTRYIIRNFLKTFAEKVVIDLLHELFFLLKITLLFWSLSSVQLLIVIFNLKRKVYYWDEVASVAKFLLLKMKFLNVTSIVLGEIWKTNYFAIAISFVRGWYYADTVQIKKNCNFDNCMWYPTMKIFNFALLFMFKCILQNLFNSHLLELISIWLELITTSSIVNSEWIHNQETAQLISLRATTPLQRYLY